MIDATYSTENNKDKQYVNIYNVLSVIKACQAVYEFHCMGKQKLSNNDMEEIFQKYWFDTKAITYVVRIFKPFIFYVLL